MNDRPYLSLTSQAQQKASDPAVSAWVAAHAGSGKTYVLTQRVLRLLLADVRPSQILCITFTKAAAANMSTRVFDKLAQWALLDDAELTRQIVETGAKTPSKGDLDFARQLFARAVETPGGLKIQTIHAFCERLLHVFPLEANAQAGFRVADDMACAELLAAATRRAIERARRESGELQRALQLIARETTEKGFQDLCKDLLKSREALRQAFDRDSYRTRLTERLGLQVGETLTLIEAEMLIGRASWPDLAARLSSGSKNDNKLADHLMRAIALAPHQDCIESYVQVFFTSSGEPRGGASGKIITAALEKKTPGLQACLLEERDRLARLLDKRKAAATVERSIALATLADAIISEYEDAKRRRNVLDYDDLIERARRLLNRSNPSWVLYKLDSQIDHILLDEAQDTSARQWDILTALVKEFCAGLGARAVERSFFAVGDDKQSIFSFQGAAPHKFDSMRRRIERDFKSATQRFEYVQLVKSFRSAPEVLRSVDDVFNFGDNGVGLSCDPDQGSLEHVSARESVPALVEIWEAIKPLERDEPADWRLPLDYASGSDPIERLAKKIAAKATALLDPANGECVTDKTGRRLVEPRDILIVVRKRGPFFDSLIRALKAADVPVAGADRLELGNHIVVDDLVALGRTALLLEDDLTLAALLKSPLVGLDDDDLLAIAPRRSGSLFDALRDAPDARLRAAAGQIDAWRRDAASWPPFEFYSEVLGRGGGRKQLVARLGQEANDAIDEFLRLALSFEREESPALASFLARVELLDISIKRDMEAAGAAVRVMTAHAAKGLEAKIVFLPDTCGAPSGKHDPKLFTLGDDEALSLVWSRGKDNDPAAIGKARDAHREAERAEQRRLLYVAMTRAEERLYICGYAGKQGPAKGCWHEMIVAALEADCEKLADPDDPQRYILRRGGVPVDFDLAPAGAGEALTHIPSFALTPAPTEHAPAPPLRPSTPLAGADAFTHGEGLAPNRHDAGRALIGRLTHALLQYLPGCAAEARPQAAERFLSSRGATLAQDTRKEIARAALALIEDEDSLSFSDQVRRPKSTLWRRRRGELSVVASIVSR